MRVGWRGTCGGFPGSPHASAASCCSCTPPSTFRSTPSPHHACRPNPAAPGPRACPARRSSAPARPAECRGAPGAAHPAVPALRRWQRLLWRQRPRGARAAAAAAAGVTRGLPEIDTCWIVSGSSHQQPADRPTHLTPCRPPHPQASGGGCGCSGGSTAADGASSSAAASVTQASSALNSLMSGLEGSLSREEMRAAFEEGRRPHQARLRCAAGAAGACLWQQLRWCCCYLPAGGIPPAL